MNWFIGFVDVTHEAIKDGVVPQAADDLQRLSGLQFFVQPAVMLHMLGFAKSDQLPSFLGNHSKAAIDYHLKTGHRETA
jgi:hypothetical protein